MLKATKVCHTGKIDANKADRFAHLSFKPNKNFEYFFISKQNKIKKITDKLSINISACNEVIFDKKSIR